MNIFRLTNFVFNHFDDLPETSVLRRMNYTPSVKENYPYIPLDSDRVTWIINDILKTVESQEKIPGQLNFCDAGCGIPVIPRIMDILGFKGSGVEYEKSYCNYYKSKGYDIRQGDILKYDFSEFDIIYTYNPINHKGKMAQALKNILSTMKKGAILYFVKANCDDVDFHKYGELSYVVDYHGRTVESIYRIIKA